jgi:hypothetical protein
MGYDFHITRAPDWSENEHEPIPREEWLAIVAVDPELRLDPQNGPCFALWIDPQTRAERGWLDWFDGNIFSKNPDPALLGKMLELAGRLQGKVQGDDGEVYTSVDEHPDHAQPPSSTARKPWWKFW